MTYIIQFVNGARMIICKRIYDKLSTNKWNNNFIVCIFKLHRNQTTEDILSRLNKQLYDK
jgi:hypothetical protein